MCTFVCLGISVCMCMCICVFVCMCMLKNIVTRLAVKLYWKERVKTYLINLIKSIKLPEFFPRTPLKEWQGIEPAAVVDKHDSLTKNNRGWESWNLKVKDKTTNPELVFKRFRLHVIYPTCVVVLHTVANHNTLCIGPCVTNTIKKKSKATFNHRKQTPIHIYGLT